MVPESKWRSGASCLLVVCLLLILPLAAEAKGKRVALVIGNSAYQYVPDLRNPANDAEDISKALQRIGFEVTQHQNLSYTDMRIALRDFAEASADAEVALAYFAGHGIEIENTNYLIPVNAALKSDRDVEFEAIRLDAIVNAIAGSSALSIVIVDACRNNPFLAQMKKASSTRSIGRGLAAVEPRGVVVGYAARGGTLAQDGDGRNSPYAQAFLEHVEEPGVELGKLFRMVRDRVVALTDGYQEPFVYGSLPGEDIFLVPKVEQAALPVPDLQESDEPVLQPQVTQKNALAAAMKVNTVRGWDLVARSYRAATLSEPEILKRMAQITPAWTRKSGRLDEIEAALLPGPAQKKEVQQSLNNSGFDVGTPDGVFGPQTRSGIKALQANIGLEPTGYADLAVLSGLGIRPLADDGASFISNPFAVRQNISELEVLGESEEVTQILGCLGLRKSVYGTFRGNLYIALVYSGSVQSARSEAQKCGLDLAAITSAAENAFIVRMISSDPAFFELGYDSKTKISYKAGPYFGFRKDPKEDGAIIGWRWFSGEPVSYTNWLPSKPNKTHGKGRKSFAQFQYEARGRRDLDDVTPTKWFDGSGWNARSVVLEGSLK